nr:hypothetical protein [Allomuricauda sp.]
MNRLAAHIFIFLYILAMARPVLPLAEYIIYEDYIAEFLCINKEKVELQCNGKCYLMQRLSEQNEEKKQNLPKIAMEEYPIGFVELICCSPLTEFCTPFKNTYSYNGIYSYLYCTSLFHPPNLV